MGATLDAARDYVERGWFVFSLWPRSKRPATENGFKDASRSLDNVESWFGGRSELNIGIATGASGLVVVDVDGEAGKASLAAWEQERGDLPDTLMQYTGGGGMQLFYRAPAGEVVRSRAGVLPGVDIRADGGYVVAPPSIHPNGRTYEWANDYGPDPTPERLSGSAAQLVEHEARREDRPRSETADGLPALVPIGQRDAAMASKAGQLRRTGASEPEIVAALGVFVRERLEGGQDDWPEWERSIERVARSVSRYEPDPDALWQQRQLERIAERKAKEAEKPATRDEGPKPDDDEADDFDSLVEPYRAWAARADDNVPALVPGILHSGVLAMLASPPKTGKTWLAYDLMLSIIGGAPFLGRYRVERTGAVLMVASEGVHTDSRDRLAGLARGKGMDPADIDGLDIIWRRGVRIDDERFIAWLTARADKYVLIVVDVLADSWVGDENKSTDVRGLLAGVRAVANAGPTVLLLHHTVKPGAETAGRRAGFNMRGSGSFYGALDDGIYLAPTTERTRTVVELETRAGAPASPEKFEFAWPGTTVDGTEPAILEWAEHNGQVAESTNLQNRAFTIIEGTPGSSKEEIRGRLGCSGKNLDAALKALAGSDAITDVEESYRDAAGKQKLRRVYYPGAGSGGGGGRDRPTLMPSIDF